MEEGILQVKYCYSEGSLNEFLKTLHTQASLTPRLQSISYMADVKGKGGQEYDSDGNLRDKMSLSNDIVAIVQYFVTKNDLKKSGK